MDSIMKSDIFFFVATIALVVIAVLLSIAIVYLVRFLKKANRISDKVENGIGEIGDRVKEQPWFNFLLRKRRKASKKNKEE